MKAQFSNEISVRAKPSYSGKTSALQRACQPCAGVAFDVAAIVSVAFTVADDVAVLDAAAFAVAADVA